MPTSRDLARFGRLCGNFLPRSFGRGTVSRHVSGGGIPHGASNAPERWMARCDVFGEVALV